jgi:uncharacterized protein YndB with AHSA1/START domain
MPDTFTIQRSRVIDAPAERLYALIEDFHAWASWSPWEKLDPQMKKTFSGPDKGVGAGYAWEGNKKAGLGSMRIVEAQPPARLGVDLHFIKPFPAKNRIDFVLTPVAGGVEVTWTMTGESTLMLKVMGLFMSMDKMVGKDFEEGLANLQRVAETAPAP